MSFTIEEATADDAAAIAKIFLSNETSHFLRLQFGTVDPGVLSRGLAERLAESIESSGQKYFIARDKESREAFSYASWTLPRAEDEPFVQQSAEEKAEATEAYRQKLLPGMNGPLVVDFREAIISMRERALGDDRYYMLGNLGTLPTYQRRGAASALAEWPFERADEEGLLVYLDTDEHSGATRMYDRLGFQKVDEKVFDLSKYGGTGIETHIGMVRWPQKKD